MREIFAYKFVRMMCVFQSSVTDSRLSSLFDAHCFSHLRWVGQRQ